MKHLRILLPALGAAALWLAAPAVEAAGDGARAQDVPEQLPALAITVKADAGWVDTGIDVAQGESLTIRASGRITLQRGNPAADCGPAGLDFMTVQQPVQDRNLGALVGKVAQLISLRIDEDTGEEIREEIVSVFHIGEESDVQAPIRGRLYLGVNETVVKDNAGEFTVMIFRRPPTSRGPAGVPG
jgi:hypothetical protein